ncbi:hypothetical protein V7S43_006120 [Phytophthora oleae]|uniref:Uncharacterized protein n=1 Tax=Phytophthora oleae TaxID=2107226 RepID=A0ABD3FSC5_9STRA
MRKNAVVFVDGYIKDRDDSVLDPCGLWQAEDMECRRLGIVSSMLSMGKDYRPDRFNKIDSNIASSLESLAISPPMVSEDIPGEVYALQRFILPSWTLEEY